jgi:hypothetical protein
MCCETGNPDRRGLLAELVAPARVLNKKIFSFPPIGKYHAELKLSFKEGGCRIVSAQRMVK